MSWGTEKTLEASKTTQHITAKFIGHGCSSHMSWKCFSFTGSVTTKLSSDNHQDYLNIDFAFWIMEECQILCITHLIRMPQWQLCCWRPGGFGPISNQALSKKTIGLPLPNRNQDLDTGPVLKARVSIFRCTCAATFLHRSSQNTAHSQIFGFPIRFPYFRDSGFLDIFSQWDIILPLVYKLR